MKNFTKTGLMAAALGSMLLLSPSTASSQAFSESFNDITTLAGSGWVTTNASVAVGSTNWFQGNPVSAGGPFDAYNGAANAYIGANYNNTGSTGTISNWLLTPNRTFRNGDVITFFTRKPSPDTYADRLEVRLSTNGASTSVGSGTAVGDYTTLLLSVNPTLVLGVYPVVWTQYTITISGLPAPTSGRIGFRYFVTGGGLSGTNSDYIGIDQVDYTPYVCPTLTVTPSSLPGGVAGTAYSQNLSQTGALGAPTYAVTAGALPPGLTLSAAGVVSGTPAATGTFNFTATVNDNSGCAGSQAYSITVVCPANPISITPFAAVCSNASPVTLSGGSPAGGTYSGTGVSGGAFDPASGSQTITYNYTDPYGCTHASTSLLTVHTLPAAPTISASGPTTFCEGGSVVLTSSATSNNTWAAGSETTQSITVEIPGAYSVSFIDGNGCQSPLSAATIVVEAPIPAAPSISSNSPVCVGDNIDFTGNTIAGSTYVWSGPNAFSSANEDPTIAASDAADAGSYSAYVIVAGCTSTTVSTTVVISPDPTASFTSSNSNFDYTFTSTSVNGTSTSWDFGDGSPSGSGNVVNHTYTQNGTFTVTLTVTNSCGTSTTTESVTIFGVSINESDLFESLNVYPNPTESTVNVTISLTESQEVTFKVYDMQGKLLINEFVGNVQGEFTKSLDMSTLAAGTYQLSLETAKGKIARRVIKK